MKENELLEKLHYYFGFDRFKGEQEDAVKTFLKEIIPLF
jgi:hypothetical protein